MVSLFDIIHKLPRWDHISTGIPSLDPLVKIEGCEGIIDFQSTPLHNTMFAVICNILISHLEQKPHGEIVVIETFNQFPWPLFQQHPRYNVSYDVRIVRYSLPTFSQILAFLMINPLEARASSALMVIVNFHEVMEFYRHQLVAAFEEALLKRELDWNTEAVENLEKLKEGELKINDFLTLPRDAPLLRVSPFVKFQSHVDAMFKHLNEFATHHQLLILLLGCMDVQSKTSNRNLEEVVTQHALGTQSMQDNLVKKGFEPSKYDQRQGGPLNSNEQKLHQRVIFYNDWYINSRHFHDHQHKTGIDRIVAVAKAEKETVEGNIVEPVYFDFSDLFYGEHKDGQDWLIDLLTVENEQLGSFLEESITLTQQQLRPSSERNAKRPRIMSEFPSSPVKVGASLVDQSRDGELALETVNQDSFIDESDVELTGTVFDDL